MSDTLTSTSTTPLTEASVKAHLTRVGNKYKALLNKVEGMTPECIGVTREAYAVGILALKRGDGMNMAAFALDYFGLSSGSNVTLWRTMYRAEDVGVVLDSPEGKAFRKVATNTKVRAYLDDPKATLTGLRAVIKALGTTSSTTASTVGGNAANGGNGGNGGNGLGDVAKVSPDVAALAAIASLTEALKMTGPDGVVGVTAKCWVTIETRLDEIKAAEITARIKRADAVKATAKAAATPGKSTSDRPAGPSKAATRKRAVRKVA